MAFECWYTSGCLARKAYAAAREMAAAVFVQKYVRMWILRHAYQRIRSAAIVMQSTIRGCLTREKYLYGRKHKAATVIQVSY